MEVRKGVVVAVWKEINNAVRFAVLKRELNWEGWELVKGGIDDEEVSEKAARREVREETGINDIIEIEDLNRMHRWHYRKNDKKIEARYGAFVVKVPKDVRIDVSKNPHKEHSKGFFLNPRDARDILTHDNQKKLIKCALKEIKEK